MAFFLISSIVLDLLDQLQIFWQLFLIELLGLLTSLGLLELYPLIYPRLSTEFDMLLLFTDLGLMEFQVRYLALFFHLSVIGSFSWFWAGSLHKNIQLMLEFLKGSILDLLFSYYALMTFLMMLSVILLSLLMILLSSLNVIWHLWQQLELASELKSDLQDTVDWGRKSLVGFNAGKTQLVLLGKSNNTGAIDVKMDEYVPVEKSSFNMLELTFSSKLDWGCYIISIAKTASKKIGTLIVSMKFSSPKVALYLYKSTIQSCIQSCMEYCCHVWAGAPSWYLEMLDKLQKWICWTVGTSIAASLKPLAHCQNISSISLFYRYYFGRCSFELVKLVPLIEVGVLVTVIDCMTFWSPFLNVTRMLCQQFLSLQG